MASSSATNESKIIEILQQIRDKFYENNSSLEFIATKLTLIELRQSNGMGESNDSIRAVDAYAKAESASCPEVALQVVCDYFKAGKTASYHEKFLEKDDRRCEYELVLLHEKVWNFKAEGVRPATR